MELDHMDHRLQSALLASILCDGEITKRYKNSRRKNNSYREHFCMEQLAYREWKCKLLPKLFYVTSKSQTIRSASSKLFTELYPCFYNEKGRKQVPIELLPRCADPLFMTIIYLDDGSLSLTRKFNHEQKLIYLTANINLYLQSFPYNELLILQKHIENQFNIHFALNRRHDGFGYILRTTSTKDSFKLLSLVQRETADLPSMYYKTNFQFRMELEREKYKKDFPEYQVLASHFNRRRLYTDEEIKKIMLLMSKRATINEIASELNRTYWSVVYKMKEIRETQKQISHD